MNIASYIHKNIDPNFKDGKLPFPTLEKEIGANEILTDFHETESQIFYITSGIVQVNILTPQHEVTVLDFCFANSFVTSTASFLQGRPSDVQLVAVTNCRLETILKKDLVSAYETSLIANKLGRYEMEKVYLKRLKRERDLLTLTAKERYVELIQNDSAIIKNLRLDVVAKYLGIHPASLSRIRSEKVRSDT